MKPSQSKASKHSHVFFLPHEPYPPVPASPYVAVPQAKWTLYQFLLHANFSQQLGLQTRCRKVAWNATPLLHATDLFSSFWSLLTCHFLRLAFPDHFLWILYFSHFPIILSFTGFSTRCKLFIHFKRLYWNNLILTKL